MSNCELTTCPVCGGKTTEGYLATTIGGAFFSEDDISELWVPGEKWRLNPWHDCFEEKGVWCEKCNFIFFYNEKASKKKGARR